MRNAILMSAAMLVLTGCSQPDNENTDSAGSPGDKLETTSRGDHIDTYFGVEVPDPYRWLEDDLSSDTADWIADQNASTRSYIDAIALRNDVKSTVARLLNFERETAPFIEGGKRYFYRNSGLQNQRVLYRMVEDGSCFLGSQHL